MLRPMVRYKWRLASTQTRRATRIVMTLPPSTPADDAPFVCASSPTHSPARPLDDRARLNALHRLDLCAVDADGTFTRFVRLTQRLLAPRVSLVALIEQDSQFIKASAERERADQPA